MKNPSRYAQHVAQGKLPVQDSETVGPEDHTVERLMLGLRIREGLPVTDLGHLDTPAAQREIAKHVRLGNLHPDTSERLCITDAGRLMADAVVRDIVASA